ncbi:hypothetical protein Scep_011513 [Stephania cephalantha]|uniref:Uncharacterized protein n=1 Tax=Stephania cephalantha TaxID=152367 RepID=A0AAP0JFG3_9MAGN
MHECFSATISRRSRPPPRRCSFPTPVVAVLLEPPLSLLLVRGPISLVREQWLRRALSRHRGATRKLPPAKLVRVRLASQERLARTATVLSLSLSPRRLSLTLPLSLTF